MKVNAFWIATRVIQAQLLPPSVCHLIGQLNYKIACQSHHVTKMKKWFASVQTAKKLVGRVRMSDFQGWINFYSRTSGNIELWFKWTTWMFWAVLWDVWMFDGMFLQRGICVGRREMYSEDWLSMLSPFDRANLWIRFNIIRIVQKFAMQISQPSKFWYFSTVVQHFM